MNRELTSDRMPLVETTVQSALPAGTENVLSHHDKVQVDVTARCREDNTAENHPRMPGQRGKQKRPTKILVTMRFSPKVLDYFKAGGEGWQTRINDTLLEYVELRCSESVSVPENA